MSTRQRFSSPGDEITVKVLRVDAVVADDKQKISLGLKQLVEDPWSKVPPKAEQAVDVLRLRP